MTDPDRPAAAPYPGDAAHRVMCQQVVELLGGYLEASLDQALHRDVAAHLDACPECRLFLDQVHLAISLTGALPDARTLPQALVQRLVAEFSQVIPPGPADG